MLWLTWMKREFMTSSVAETARLAEAIGKRLRGGECLELASDLGGGKTTFVASLVSATGSSDKVSSPSFTISKQYESADYTIHHFDFYRLGQPGQMSAELSEVLHDEKAVVIVEWANSVNEVLPKQRIVIEIEKLADSADSRKFAISVPDKFIYILEDLKL